MRRMSAQNCCARQLLCHTLLQVTQPSAATRMITAIHSFRPYLVMSAYAARVLPAIPTLIRTAKAHCCTSQLLAHMCGCVRRVKSEHAPGRSGLFRAKKIHQRHLTHRTTLLPRSKNHAAHRHRSPQSRPHSLRRFPSAHGSRFARQSLARTPANFRLAAAFRAAVRCFRVFRSARQKVSLVWNLPALEHAFASFLPHLLDPQRLLHTHNPSFLVQMTRTLRTKSETKAGPDSSRSPLHACVSFPSALTFLEQNRSLHRFCHGIP
mmetsp:Transcript_4083/g.11217  ORF Transcript_4083/g.11217 Transcript_4083/m.11217 type:complete len:265 (+) Transcript_4083:1569-2363(+)